MGWIHGENGRGRLTKRADACRVEGRRRRGRLSEERFGGSRRGE